MVRPDDVTMLAFDPSMRCTGWVLWSLLDEKPVACGVVRTTIGATSASGLSTEVDEGRRGCVVFDGVAEVVSMLGPLLIAMEQPVGSQDARAAKAFARSTLAHRIAFHVVAPNVQVLHVAQGTAKWAATGSKSPGLRDPETGKVIKGSAKVQVREAVKTRFGRELWRTLFADGGVTDDAGREACFDAAAVAMAANRTKAARLIRIDNERGNDS